MKKSKRLLSVLLALVLIFSMTSLAYAADDGTITVTNATAGKDYDLYKVFDLTYRDDVVNYTYTTSGDTDAFLTALQGQDSPFILNGEGPTYTVVKKDTATAATISTFLTGQKDNLQKIGDTVNATSGTVEFNNLAYGYYYVTSSLGAAVTIDSTTPSVKVVDKNMKPGWDNEDPENPDPDYPDNPGKVILVQKLDENGDPVVVDGNPVYDKVLSNSVNYGDTVKFSIAVNATAFDGTDLITYYYVKDTLAKGFGEAKNIKVYVDGVEKTANTDYTVAKSTDASTGESSFQITIPYGLKYEGSAKIEVVYDATVESGDDVVLAGEGNLNTANFTYTVDDNYDPEDPNYPDDPGDPNYPDDPYDPQDPNNPDPPYPSDNQKETTTYVYALGIKKVDPKGNVLTGAEFSVKDSDGNSIYATGSNGEYSYALSTAEGATDTFSTNDKGILVIKGVKADTYKVTEKTAPEGFSPLAKPVDLQAEIAGEYTKTITTYFDADGNVTSEVTTKTEVSDTTVPVAGLVVVNNSGELPSTGGIGTTIFYILGGLLVAGSGIFMFVRRRVGLDK